MSHPFKKHKTRLGEWIAEWSIRLVASVSIIVIFLIFVFVFKEAATLFTAVAETPTEQSTGTTSSESAEMQPETYGSEDADPSVTDASAASDDPDVYNPDIADPTIASGEPGAPGQFIYKPKNPRYPEIYNPETGLLPADIDDESAQDAVADTTTKKGIYAKLAGDTWQPVGETPKFGILPLVTGTLKTTLAELS